MLVVNINIKKRIEDGDNLAYYHWQQGFQACIIGYEFNYKPEHREGKENISKHKNIVCQAK